MPEEKNTAKPQPFYKTLNTPEDFAEAVRAALNGQDIPAPAPKNSPRF